MIPFRKIATGQRDDYTIGCLLDHKYFEKNYKLTAIHLCKQQKLDADPKLVQQINFCWDLEEDTHRRRSIFVIIEVAKETVLDFSNGTVKALWFYIILL